MKIRTLVFLALVLSVSCGKDDEFACDKNATFAYNGGTQCAHASVENHSLDVVNGDESFLIAFSSQFTNFKLTIMDEDNLAINKDYTYPTNAFITGPGHNQTFSLKVTITKLDRNSKLLSGTFSFETERDVNSAPVAFNSQGTFTDLPF